MHVVVDKGVQWWRNTYRDTCIHIYSADNTATYMCTSQGAIWRQTDSASTSPLQGARTCVMTCTSTSCLTGDVWSASCYAATPVEWLADSLFKKKIQQNINAHIALSSYQMTHIWHSNLKAMWCCGNWWTHSFKLSTSTTDHRLDKIRPRMCWICTLL